MSSGQWCIKYTTGRKPYSSKSTDILPEIDFGRSWSHHLEYSITWVKVLKYVIFIALKYEKYFFNIKRT